MEKIRLRFDPTDNSLRVLFDEPRTVAYLSPIVEDTPGDWFFIKNEAGQIIGLELMLYHLPSGSLSVAFETAPLLEEARITKSKVT